jgi:hypothetical protein
MEAAGFPTNLVPLPIHTTSHPLTINMKLQHEMRSMKQQLGSYEKKSQYLLEDRKTETKKILGRHDRPHDLSDRYRDLAISQTSNITENFSTLP